MTNEEIRLEVRLLGYPSNLLDSEIDAAIRQALRDLKSKYPAMVLGVFNLKCGQQLYDLFNPVVYADTSQGAFPGGIRAYKLFIGTCDDSGSLDIFGLAPLFQSMSFSMIGYNIFWTPGDWLIWELDWSALAHRFQPGEFEHVSDLPGSPIRVYQTPSADGTALLQFTMPRTVDQLQNEDESWFLKLVEAQCCRTLARKFSLCAGMTFSEAIKDEGRKVAYWEREAKERFAEAWALFDSLRRDQIHPVQRSHGP